MDSDDGMREKKNSWEKWCCFVFLYKQKSVHIDTISPKKYGKFFKKVYVIFLLILHVQRKGNNHLPAAQVVLSLMPAALMIICSEEECQIGAVSWTEGLLMRASSSQLSFCLSESSCGIITLTVEQRNTQRWTPYIYACSILPSSGCLMSTLFNLVPLKNLRVASTQTAFSLQWAQTAETGHSAAALHSLLTHSTTYSLMRHALVILCIYTHRKASSCFFFPFKSPTQFSCFSFTCSQMYRTHTPCQNHSASLTGFPITRWSSITLPY